MKPVFSILLLLQLCSCTTIKMLSNQVIHTKKACLGFQNNPAEIIIPLEIDQQKTDFLFDTGATISCLIESTAIKNFANKKFGTFVSAKGADGKKVKVKFMAAEIHTSLFDSENKVLTFINMPKSNCNKSKKSYSGIIGLDAFFKDETMLFLNFAQNKICNIDTTDLTEKIKDVSYHLVKSECKRNQIFIYLLVEGKELKFKLDTGYTGNIIIPFSEKTVWRSRDKIELEGSLYKTVSSLTTGKEILYEKIPVVFAGENLLTKMNVSTSIKAQNIGLNFIKAFDWIIDYNHNKVYVKRNQNPIESNFNRKVMYYVKTEMGKLKVIVKEKSQTQYHLGDEIIEVNNQKVTTENNCELQDFLNKTDDWNALQLKVIPGSP